MSFFSSFSGACWRAVPVGREHAALDGTEQAARYNRPGQRTLYVSGSPAGVAAAMARYGDAPRALVALHVAAERLIDLREAGACLALGIDVSRANEDWVAALDRGREPASWAVSDCARAAGAAGLIDGSRRVPGLWHLALFWWRGDGVIVRLTGPSRE